MFSSTTALTLSKKRKGLLSRAEKETGGAQEQKKHNELKIGAVF